MTMKNFLLVAGGFLLGMLFSVLAFGSYEQLVATQDFLLRLLAGAAVLGMAVKFCLKPSLEHMKREIQGGYRDH